MTEHHDWKRNITAALDDERRVRVCIQEAQELERSRITAIEDTLNVHARYFPEILNDLNNLNNNIKTNKRRLNNHATNTGDDLKGVEIAINAVLEAHTHSLFRLEARLDRIAEQFAAAGFAPLNQSHAEDVTDQDDPHPETPIDLKKSLVDAASTNTRTSHGPRPTVPAEQRPIS